MKITYLKNSVLFVVILTSLLSACGTAQPAATQAPASIPQSGFLEKPALPNESGIEGVQTFPDKPEYHNHVQTVVDPKKELPPVFGEHYPAWQNCGIYDQPVELGSALHSMEHGAVWLTYRPD